MTNGNLIKALEIFKKYIKETGHNFHCEHDIFYFCVDRTKIHPDDMAALEAIGVFYSKDGDSLAAYVSC